MLSVGTNDEIIELLYQAVLRRAPDRTEHGIYDRLLRRNEPLPQLLRQLMSSAEFREKELVRRGTQPVFGRMDEYAEAGPDIADGDRQQEIKVLFLQTADQDKYREMLKITSETVNKYCGRHGFIYEYFLGIWRGYHPWQATYNRIPLLKRIVNSGYRGWVCYLDADAFIADLDFDLRGYLGDLRDVAFIAPSDRPFEPDRPYWRVNAGAFFINLGTIAGRAIVADWARQFEAISDVQLQQGVEWSQMSNDQDMLHRVLRDLPDGATVIHTIRGEPGVLAHEAGTFIKQIVRGKPSFQARVERLRVETGRVLGVNSSEVTATTPVGDAPVDRPRGNMAVLVLGMHRSGTSTLTGCLQAMGANLGPELLTPDKWNPKGYFEHAGIVHIHEKILETLGGHWTDPGALPEDWVNDPRIAPFRHRLAAIVQRDFINSPLWAVKDPRLCRLLPIWLGVLRELDITPKAVLIVRSPAEVSASLQIRNGVEPEKATMLWLSHIVAAERYSRVLKRTVILYEDLVRDWKGELEHLRGSLGPDFSAISRPPADELLAGFVDSELRHHREVASSDNPMRALAVAVYNAMVRWRREGVSPVDVCNQAVQTLGNAWRHADASTADALSSAESATQAAPLKGVPTIMVSSYYDNSAMVRAVAAGQHRSLVGGLWDEIGQLQVDFLKSRGLSRSSTLVDVGCGCLRGGVGFVDFLEPTKYFGLDINRSLLDAGYDIELGSRGLQGKLPRANLVCDSEFNFSTFPVFFDFAIAQSLFSHLPASYVRLCLSRLSEKMKPGGAFYATFFIVPENHPPGLPFDHPHGVRSFDNEDIYHYRFTQLSRICEGLPWAAVLVGDWGHPRDQQMVLFRRVEGAGALKGLPAARDMSTNQQTQIGEGAASARAMPSEAERSFAPKAIAAIGPSVGRIVENDMGAATSPTLPQPPARWFHSFDLGKGETISGIKPLVRLKMEADIIFSEPISGKTVLDIGAWDGYFSFEAERRGASEVLATDHFCWSGPGWGTKAGFNYMHARLASRVRALDVDVFDLDPEALGRFDVCLFLGVLYHLKNPLGGLEKLAQMTGEYAVIETEVAEPNNPNPVLRFYEGKALNNDPTNFFAPNILCLEAMLREVGFRRFNFTPRQSPTDAYRGRTIVHAWK